MVIAVDMNTHSLQGSHAETLLPGTAEMPIIAAILMSGLRLVS